MSIVADTQRSGLWVNDAWRENAEPGTFAVVIGASRYHHLTGGDGKIADPDYDLGQLHVSALTSFRFFQWLTTSYQNAGAPLARVWLALSPTDEERRYEPALPNVPGATLAECKRAVLEWFGAMEAMPPEHAARSRAIFFFSGHGLEVATDRQILLPADYLAPPGPVLNDALSTRNLYEGLRKLAVEEQIFVLDACRNDHEELRQARLEGANILTAWPAYQVSRGLVAPLVYATASSLESWEPSAPTAGDDVSLFGRALLDGLCATRGMTADCSAVPCRIQLLSLAPFLNRRVGELHALRNSRVNQPVRMGGTVADVTLTEIASPPPAAPPQASPAAPRELPLEPPNPLDEVIADLPEVEPVTGRKSAGGAASFPTERIEWLDRPRRPTPRFEELPMGRLWAEHQLIALDPAVTGDRRTTVEVDDVSFDREGRIARLTFELSERGAHWLELTDGPRRFACVLPHDAGPRRPRFVLELTPGPDGALAKLEANLAIDPNHEPRSRAARVWARYRASQITEAIKEYGQTLTEPGEAELLAFLGVKFDSPLSALVATLVLLRISPARQSPVPERWIRNLAGMTDDGRHFGLHRLPDGPPLLAEWLLRTIDLPVAAAAAERRRDRSERPPTLWEIDPKRALAVTEALLELEQRGLPHLGESLGLASGLVREMLVHGFPDADERSPTVALARARLGNLRRRTERALALQQTGGLFTAFAGRASDVGPELIAPSAANPPTREPS